MHDVFISYSFDDKTVADGMCQYLEQSGIRCWYAPRNIPHGKDFREAIMEAIRQSRCLILIYSSHSNVSKDVLHEITAASDHDVTIVPFRIEDVPMAPALAYYLNGIHWLDATKHNFGQSLKQLRQTVSELRSETPEPSLSHPAPLPQKVPLWKRALVALGILLAFTAAVLIIDRVLTEPATPRVEGPQAEETQIQRMNMQEYSYVSNYRYPFYSLFGFSGTMDKYFLQDSKTGELKLCKTDTGFILLDGIQYTPQDYTQVYVCLQEGYTVAYFLEVLPDTLRISAYDTKNAQWLNQEGVILPMSETEYPAEYVYSGSYISDGESHLNEMMLLIFDTQRNCLTKAVTVYPDSTIRKVDISEFGFQECISGIDIPGEYVLLMIGENHALTVFDTESLETFNYIEAEVFAKYSPYLTADNEHFSQNRRYMACKEINVNDTMDLQIWDLQTGKSQSLTFSKNFSYSFYGDDQLLYFNAENNTLTLRSLEKQSDTPLLDAGYFEETDVFTDMPFAFSYSPEMDACMFVVGLYNKDKDTISYRLVVTRTDGTVLAVSSDVELPNETTRTELYVSGNMLFWELSASDPEVHLKEGVSSVILGMQFHVKEDGTVLFLPPPGN